jgi:hypothetical protein
MHVTILAIQKPVEAFRAVREYSRLLSFGAFAIGLKPCQHTALEYLRLLRQNQSSVRFCLISFSETEKLAPDLVDGDCPGPIGGPLGSQTKKNKIIVDRVTISG